MSYSTYPAYGAYQPATPYSHYQSGHYPAQYPLTSTTPTTPISTYSLYHLPPPKSPPPPELPPPPPSVTPKEASKAIQRLLSCTLKDAGFDAVQSSALERLETEVAAFFEFMYERAHEYANLANRSGPMITDLMLACGEMKLEPKALRQVASSHRKKRKRGREKVPTLVPPPPRSPSPDLLPSDEEDMQPVVPATLRTMPSYLPRLPPRHTYLRTPPSPPKRAALPSLEKKLKTASLVQQSLKNLLLATEDSEGQEDAELLGHIVNWETGLYPRKRWRIGG